MLGLLGIFLFYLVTFLVSFSCATFVVWLMARVLMFFFPFAIFEAMLISTFLSGFSAYIVMRFMDFSAMLEAEIEEKSGGLAVKRMGTDQPPITKAVKDADHEEFDVIPTTRFFNSPTERTWQNWLRKEIANDIYAEFQDSSQAVSNLNDTQTQELAIRLTDLSVDMLKRKTARARKLKITKGALAKEVEKNDQRPYDDAILTLAVAAFNMNMDYYHEELLGIVKAKSWTQRAKIEDED